MTKREMEVEIARLRHNLLVTRATKLEYAQLAKRRLDEVLILRARIDELMLEYCPGEMTPEQLGIYEQHQEPEDERARR